MVLHRSKAISVEVKPDARGVISHAGVLPLQGLCDRIGLTDAITTAFGPRGPLTIPRGAVMRDLAVAIADGGDAVIAVEHLRKQCAAFGLVASDTTVWRGIAELTEPVLEDIQAAMACARAYVWRRSPIRLPRLLCVDVDGTLVTAHTNKQLAAPTYKKGFGFHPIVCSLDATNEVLAVLQRPGNAGANCGDDLLDALTLALAQLPDEAFNDELHDLTVRMDSGGHSHKVVDYLLGFPLDFVIGADMTTDVWTTIGALDTSAWTAAIDQNGEERDYAYVAELRAPAGWGEGVRMIVRREYAHEGAPMRLLDMDGYRYQVLITNLTTPDIAYISAMYNGRGRAEQVIGELKNCGLGKLPAHHADHNQAWILASMLAHSLVRWTQLLLLDGEWNRARLDRIRNYLFHTGARLTRHAGRIQMHIDENWPALTPLTRAFDRLRQIPAHTIKLA